MLSPGGSGYFTCKQNMKFVTTKFRSGRLHEKHVVATWNLGNHLSIYHYLLHNNPEELSSQTLRGGSLQSSTSRLGPFNFLIKNINMFFLRR